MLPQTSVPGFSAEQVACITKIIEQVLDAALDKRFSPLQSQPQQSITTHKLAKQEKEEPLLQAVSKSTTESKRSKQSTGNSNPSKSGGILSTLPNQVTKQLFGDLTCFTRRYNVAASASFAYTRFGKDLEATGQG
jgi:translation elongation factor EF-G